MIISTAPKRTSRRWLPQEITWEQLCTRLSRPIRTGETVAEYRRMSPDDRSERKDQGGFVGGTIVGGARVRGSCRDRWLITLDADRAHADDWEAYTSLSDAACCIYSTHSHTPDEPRLRWVLPLSRAITPEEYGAVSRALAYRIGIEAMDVSTYQPERLMYWPSCPSDGDFIFRRQDGAPIDPDRLLSDVYHGDWQNTALWPISSREQAVVRHEAVKAGDPTEKRGVIGLFCRTWDVERAIAAFLPEVYIPAGEGRYTYAGGTSAAGAVVYGDGSYLYSHHEHDPAGGRLCNAFDLVRIHKFGAQDEGKTAEEPSRLPSYRAMMDWATSLPEIRAAAAQERMSDFSDMAGPGPAAEDAAPDPEDWKKLLTLKPKTAELEETRGNVLLVLRNDPDMAGVIGYNEFADRVVYRKAPPWRPGLRVPPDGVEWGDADGAQLRVWLEQRWGLANRANSDDALAVVAIENVFHPVRDYLNALKWDGVPRVDEMLIRWMGAEDTEYVRAVTRKWMAAAVARVMRPGVKFDCLLMLIGPQGIGKSTLAQQLSRGYFNDSIQRIDDKSAYEGLRGVWIVELAELNAVKKSEVESIKTFFSKSEDKYRAAYARYSGTYQRQCVFFATTNDVETLRDRTGNRRFWPVQVGGGSSHFGLRGFAAEVDQLWAESVQIWRGGETLWLDDPRLAAQSAAQSDRFRVQDELVGEIEEYLDTPLPDNWEDMDRRQRRDYIQGNSIVDASVCTRLRTEISIVELRNEMTTTGDLGRTNDGFCRHVANILNTLPGWEKAPRKKRIAGYGPQYYYFRAIAPELQ